MSIFEDLDELPESQAANVTYFVPERNSKRLKIFWVDIKEDKDDKKRYRLVGPKFHSVKEVFQFYEENSLAWPTVKCAKFSRIDLIGSYILQIGSGRISKIY